MKQIMMILVLFLNFSGHAMQNSEIAELTSDKTIYAISEVPILQAHFFTNPDSSDFEFDIISKLNGVEIESHRVDASHIGSSPAGLAVGSYTWSVQVVLQDAFYASDLKSSISYFKTQISYLNTLIASETDPVILAQLQSRKNEFIQLKSSSESELSRIRSPIEEPQILQFNIQ